MTLFEGILIANLVILCYCVYSIGSIKKEMEALFQGLAVVMMEQEEAANTRH